MVNVFQNKSIVAFQHVQRFCKGVQCAATQHEVVNAPAVKIAHNNESVSHDIASAHRYVHAYTLLRHALTNCKLKNHWLIGHKTNIQM